MKRVCKAAPGPHTSLSSVSCETPLCAVVSEGMPPAPVAPHHVHGELSIANVLVDDGRMVVRGGLVVRTAHGVDHRLFRARQIYVPARPRAAIHTADISDEIGVDAVVDDAAAREQAVADIAGVGGHDMAGAEPGTDGDVGAVGGRGR